MASISSSFVNTKRQRLPVVPLRDMVVFPHMMAPFIIGRESICGRTRSTASRSRHKTIFLVAQRDPKVDDPMRQDIYDIGVVARVVQNLKLPNGNVKVMVEGIEPGQAFRAGREGRIGLCGSRRLRDRLSHRREASDLHQQSDRHFRAVCEVVSPSCLRGTGLDNQAGRCRSVHRSVGCASDGHYVREAVTARDPQSLRSSAAAPRSARYRAREVQHRQARQCQCQEADGEGPEGVLPQREDQGHPSGAGRKDDAATSSPSCKRESKSRMPTEAKEKAEQELKRLEAMPPVSAEATVSRNYIDWLVSVPVEEEEPRDQGSRTSADDSRRGSLRSRQDQGAHPRVPGGAPADQEDAKLDHLLCRATRGR